MSKVSHALQSRKAYSAQTPEKKLRQIAQIRKWQEEHASHYAWLIHKHNAKNRKLEDALTEEQFTEIISCPCSYCGLTPAGGVDRANSAVGYTIANSVSCCKTCNYAKRAMSVAEFYAWIERIVNYNRK